MNNSAYRGNISDEMGVTRSCVNVMFLLDTSNSMMSRSGNYRRIDQLNATMPMVLGALLCAAEDAEVDLYVRIISFSNLPHWVMGCAEKGVSIADAYDNWRNISTEMGTNTAAAIRLACTAMHTKYIGAYSHPSVVILVSDGNSDNRTDTQNAIEELRNAMSGGNPNKRDKVWRFAIGVEGFNEAELQDFAMTGWMEDEFGNELPNKPMIFRTDNATDIAKIVKYSMVEDDEHDDSSPEYGDECPIIIDI